jgi:hypothetical protein
VPNLGKIAGHDLLVGPIGFDLALGDDCESCCCECGGAPLPYNDAPWWSCVPGDYQPYTVKTTATYTISGLPVNKPFYVADNCANPLLCNGSFPDPTGTWAFTLGSSGLNTSYQNSMLSCDTVNFWYVVYACMTFGLGGFQCNNTDGIASWTYLTRGFAFPKSGPPPTLTSGWVSGAICTLGGSDSTRGQVNFRMPNDCCATVWQRQLGPWTGGGVNYNCQESCNTTQCFPKCFTNAVVLSTTHDSFGICRPGVDYSGLTVSLAFS